MLIIRLLLLAGIAYGVYRTLRWLRAVPPDQRRRRYWKAALVGGAAVVVVLALFGRVHWLGAVIAAALPLLQRLAPLALPWIQRRYQTSRQAGGHEDPGPNAGPRETAALSRGEALAILGLAEPASREQILQAHRRLIQKLHPDQGGSDYLAARINAARAALLKKA